VKVRPTYQCLHCGKTWTLLKPMGWCCHKCGREKHPQVDCPQCGELDRSCLFCGHFYIKWTNYEEWRNANR